ncbi:MAG: HAMP domain-containing protein [Spirochaetales bacterium]|nr:HAMP domain-containing protein [Spirochaetales bacterium]
MFSGRNNRFKADLKFSVIFGSVFWISALIIYLFVFIYIFSTLRQEARSGIQVRLLGYWAIDQSGGHGVLKDSIDVDVLLSGEAPFFVRISDDFNNTVLLTVPANWESFDFRKLEEKSPVAGGFITLRSPQLDYVLEVGNISITENYTLQVGMSDENRQQIMSLLSGSLGAALVILVGVSFIIGFIVSHRFLLPVRRLEKAVAEVIETGKIESRIQERPKAGELDQLIVSFNRMLSKIEELVKGMAGALDTVAHDLRTPLTRFRMVAEKALSRQEYSGIEPAKESYRTALEQAVIESDTVLRMMTMLMDISEAETGTLKLNKTEFSPIEKIREVVDVYLLIAEDRNISITIEEPAWTGVLSADPDRFRQAAGNLIDNAVKYGRDNGSVIISVSSTEGELTVSFRDDGEGISEADLPEIWKRLYRGKSSKDGLGLGLSLVNAIVMAHQGRVEVESRLEEGSVFRMIFPLSLQC